MTNKTKDLLAKIILGAIVFVIAFGSQMFYFFGDCSWFYATATTGQLPARCLKAIQND